MRVQILISGLLLDPGCYVGADFLIIRSLVDWPIANKVLVCLFKLLRGAAAVDREYSVRHVIAALLVDCFVQLCIDFMVNEGLVSHYLERENQFNN